ncbi:MAG: hypothetical protein Q9207_002174 [Kuettlingeria erythrocarpa]
MPASTRRSAQKRQTDTRPRPDPDVPDSSPSQPAAKKKKPSVTVQRRPRRPKTPESQPDDESDSDESSSQAEAQTIADKVIPHLLVARAPVQIAFDHSNSRTEGTRQGVQAYAKICGRDWTYYVKELRIVVGRSPDGAARYSSSIAESSPQTLRRDELDAHIDLGPSKTVSRNHAEIFYGTEDNRWHAEVKGRNGLKVNDQDFRRGQQSVLGCGDVLEVAGTQMMFVTAGERANIHPQILQQMEERPEDGEAARTKVDAHAHPETLYLTASSSSQLPPPSNATAVYQTNGQATIVPAPADFVRPTTPVRSPRRSQQHVSAIQNSPAFGRGFMVESTEQIDYSSDAMKDLKPSIPYGVMITQAILSNPSESITLSGIYDWIKRNFAYYRYLRTNWQNSIRHNLSLHTAFEKIPRGPNEPGKGMKWHINDDKRAEMIAQVAKHMKKTNVRCSSAPNSPSTLRDESSQVHHPPALPAALQPFSSESNTETNGAVKTSPPVRSPPLAVYPSAQEAYSYPTAQESYTPSCGSGYAALPMNSHSHGLPMLSDDPSPLPIRRNNLKAGLTGSSPVLGTSLYYDTMVTPAPRQHNLNMLHPNTVKLPTSHMADSSPAPFWKYAPPSALGSTPSTWPEMSPLKAGNLESSSPPPGATTGNAFESPTRGRGARVGLGLESQDVDDDEDNGGIDLMR